MRCTNAQHLRSLCHPTCTMLQASMQCTWRLFWQRRLTLSASNQHDIMAPKRQCACHLLATASLIPPAPSPCAAAATAAAAAASQASNDGARQSDTHPPEPTV